MIKLLIVAFVAVSAAFCLVHFFPGSAQEAFKLGSWPISWVLIACVATGALVWKRVK